MRKLVFLCCCLLGVLFDSCKKEFDKANWDTEVLLPLVNTKLNINNILPDSVLQANADSTLKIVFQNNIFNFSMDSLFKIPDTLIYNPYSIPFPIIFNPGDVIPFPAVNSTTYKLPGVKLRNVIIQSGFVSFKVKSKIREVTNFEYSIPSATLNGVPFKIKVMVPARVNSTPGEYSQMFDLSGYSINLTGVSGAQVNTIYTSLSAKISPDAFDSVLIMPKDSLIIENKFYDMVPYYAKGYFGQNNYEMGPSQTDFTVFNSIVRGTIKIEDVKFNLKIENAIGMDSRVMINNLSSINSRNGNLVNLSGAALYSPININRASDNGGNVISTTVNFPLTSSNSNIKSFIENLPDKLGYSMQINANPLGDISGSNDFIYSDKLINAQLNMEMPLSLIASNLTLVDTLDINLSKNNDTENIHSGILTLFANNGFPFDAGIQFYLLNDKNIVVDSLLAVDATIEKATVNSNYRVVEPKRSKIAIPISESKLNLLYSTKKIMLKVKFNSGYQPQYMKIYSDYTIDVKLVGDINYTVQLR
jgi:hypothetical protein